MSSSVPPATRRIVSSRHLAEGEGWEASELEYGMIIAYNAFSRWITRCMAAAGNPDLTSLEILVLHNTNHRDREVFYRTSSSGTELIEAYRAVRNACLIDSMGHTDIKGDDLRDIAAQLRTISGQYDQASRAAASL